MKTRKPNRGDRLALALADRVLAYPWVVVTLAVLLVLSAGYGARHLEFSNNYRVFFSPDNPELVAFEEFQDIYTKNDNILFVLQPEEGSAFDPDTAAAVEWLTAEAWKIPYAIRVDSVTNFQHSWANGDELTVEDLVRDADAMPTHELDRREGIALAEPLLRGNLISPSARTTGVNVTLQYPEESLTEVPEAVSHARGLADELRTRHPGMTVALSGVSMLNNAFAEAGQIDAVTLMPGMFLALLVLMVIVLRSATGVTGTMLVISFSTLTAFGLAGWAGVKLDPVSLTAAIIILTLGLADSIHILVTTLGLMRSGRKKAEAIRESLRLNAVPVAITSVTTIIGFLALNFSDAPPFRLLGNITAVGIFAAFVYSITLLPAVVAISPTRVGRKTSSAAASEPLLGRLADWVTSRHRPVLAVMGAVSLALAFLAPTVDLNDEFVKYFDHRVDFRRDAEFGIDNLSGIYLLEFSVEADEPGGISEPAYLESLERFTAWLRDQPEVTHVYSYSDVIKRLNKNMNADDPAFYRIPDDREMAAQYLLLYELSLPYGLDLNDRISLDKGATRVTATVGEISTAETRRLLDRTSAWLDANVLESMRAEPTGAQVMFAHISERNVESMLRGNAVAVVLIAAVMMLALGSVSIGALSLIPNAIPILMTFGVWALLVRQVGMAAATVSATSLGIVVDDTVHFLSKYLRARRERGADRAGAIRYAFETVGPALISTTIILSFGFAVLALSSFRINAQMGLLTTLAIVLALVIDFFLLPALLMVGERKTEKESQTMKMNRRLSAAPTALLLGALLFTPAALPAADLDIPPTAAPEERGWAIAARSDRSDRGFSDSTVELEMVLRNKAGKETSRTLTLWTLEVPNEDLGDRSLIVFERPADIDGTALLSHAKIVDPDDQWLYLPALKRVKRISSVNKSGPFVGSEFAFEDFTALELEKYSYRYLRSETCGDMQCDVVEQTPRYEHSGYTKQIAWVDQDVYQVRKVEFYDRRGDLLKTLEATEYREYEGGYWRPHHLQMTNHQTGKETALVYSDYRFGTGLKESDFVRGALKRRR